MHSRFLLACVFFLLCASHGPTADAQPVRPLNEEFRLHENFQSKFLTKNRNVIVWLPPGYASEPAKRYPVLYMHDGASVFVLWRIDEIAKPLITSGEVEPLIIVMVPNGGTQDDRFDEFTPTKPPNFKSGGKADSYGRMLVEELVRNVKELKSKPALRIWLDIGTGEGQRAVDDAKELRDALVKKDGY